TTLPYEPSSTPAAPMPKGPRADDRSPHHARRASPTWRCPEGSTSPRQRPSSSISVSAWPSVAAPSEVALCPSAGSVRGYARAAVSLDVLGHRSGVTGLDPSAD